jgi:hypothetical protein
MGGEQTHFVHVPDGVCSIQSWTWALMELVPDPQCDSYRFRAEVRHEKSNTTGGVGIYFAHQTFQVGPDVLHYFGSLEFNDVQDQRVEFQRSRPTLPSPPPAPTGNPVSLAPTLLVLEAQGKQWGGAIPGLNPTLFEAAGLNGGPWRRLVVEITPRSVRGYWGDREDGPLVAVGELTAEDWVRNTQTTLARWSRKNREIPHAQSLRPEWLPRGSLGLSLTQGSASFRRVVVEPLSPSN